MKSQLLRLPETLKAGRPFLLLLSLFRPWIESEGLGYKQMLSNSLVIVGCSATKLDTRSSVPAIHLYDGPIYRILRAHLKRQRWSTDLSLGVLSAKHGLIGAMAPISTYDLRMSPERADNLRATVSGTLAEYAKGKSEIHLVLGKDYLRAIDTSNLLPSENVLIADGSIGLKLRYFSQLLASLKRLPRLNRIPKPKSRPLYFLPDWDDFLDTEFDFHHDSFSAERKADRKEAHSIELIRPRRLCDGILVSLAQQLSGSKGLLRRLPPNDPSQLRPRSVRDHFGLAADQWAFGDCGAFSYVNEDEPAISVAQAVALYDLHEFDLGASVDHIPVTEVEQEDGKRTLSTYERRKRVLLTRDNAAVFLDEWRSRGANFVPVGVIQAISPRGYAQQIHEYLEMGYTHIALGGLVPRSDSEITEVIEQLQKVSRNIRRMPWIHLLGVFRPKLQALFREGGISSFDSATYFRKAWLRSDQNYLATDGNWYAAIRVPPSDDPRTMKRLESSGLTTSSIRRLEQAALIALRKFDSKIISVEKCLQAILKYDALLDRGEFSSASLEDQYRRTLEARPWTKCQCNFCTAIGIDVAVFRGYNRNKRRGAHNTMRLYEQLRQPS